MAFLRRATTLAALGLLAVAPALAGPRVVPGLGPQDMAAPADRPGRYGGGFIELLMTGHAAPAGQPMASAPSRPGAFVASAEPQDQEDGGTPAAPVRPVPGYEAPRKAVDPIYLRQEVPFAGTQAPGTIVVDTTQKFLYLVEGGGQALRYGIGVGRPGFLWAGEKTITRKAEWPAWTPPPEMLKRRPDLPGHMDGGMANPLGARAMYLGSSLYRIHGTNEPDTIGTNVSSGCIRLTNDDVADLFGRVRVGTRVLVM